MNRRELAYEASQEAADAREDARIAQDTPLSILDVTEQLGARVIFVDIDMEGIYEQGRQPRVLLSPYRPLARRMFNCAHELGHHRFGHGSSIDELKAMNSLKRQTDIPEEVLANSFASFFLMPPIGIQRAFHRRGLKPSMASQLDVYTIASDFGVGYSTLVTHLAFGLDEIGHRQRQDLEKWTNKDIRRQLLERADPSHLTVVDDIGEATAIDVEIGGGILTPAGTLADGNALAAERTVAAGQLWRAKRQGSARLQIRGRKVQVRVMRERFIGWSQYRFMEDIDDNS